MSQDVPASAGQPELFCFERWPFSLRELREPGTHAYLWGEFPPGPYVAIVGSREASEVGNAAARRLARELAAEGVTIVSGGAVGIDASAHRGALDAGGRTLVVGPVWLDRAYPEENRPLFAEILKRGGAYCCVTGEETKAHYPSFFRRNEALVALCQLLIVGESGF
ncbi:MAG TPA: DNA-processing protein DprA, partial [Polyangiaceae bacterium]|nr:DNA-processing protein DprA [Polyangiaceae bacterium]